MGGRCTGGCCKDFTLNVSPGDIAARSYSDPEAKQLLGMLVYRRTIEDAVGPGGFAHYYDCRNLQANGDCGIYETRPDMCRRFPCSGRCTFEGCTWDAVCTQDAPAAEQ